MNMQVQPGSAGAALKDAIAACDLLNWAKDTTLTDEEIQLVTEEWVKEQGLTGDEATELSQKFTEVSGMVEKIAAGEADDLLADAGAELSDVTEEMVNRVNVLLIAGGADIAEETNS